MTLLVPNNGEADALANFLNKTAPENLVLKLFVSNTTPAETDVAATYTEASGNGYAAVSLTAANWTIVEGAPTEATYPEITFTFTGALGNVYGYYIVGATSGRIKFVERFTNAPFLIQNNGDQIKITPKISQD